MMRNSFVWILSTSYKNLKYIAETHLWLALKPFTKLSLMSLEWITWRVVWLLLLSDTIVSYGSLFKAQKHKSKYESMSNSVRISPVFATLGALGAITSFCYVYKTRWERDYLCKILSLHPDSGSLSSLIFTRKSRFLFFLNFAD